MSYTCKSHAKRKWLTCECIADHWYVHENFMFVKVYLLHVAVLCSDYNLANTITIYFHMCVAVVQSPAGPSLPCFSCVALKYLVHHFFSEPSFLRKLGDAGIFLLVP